MIAMQLNETTTTPPPRTFSQWLGFILRAFGERLDPVTIERPVADIRRAQAYDAEIALLDAEAQAERYGHTVNMLRDRLKRLRNADHHSASALPPRTDS